MIRGLMKILTLNASPTMKKGMTSRLMDNFLEGAKDAGAEIETVYVQKLKINYCIGCFGCWVKTPGVCVHKDDMVPLLEKVRNADCLLMATPLYADGMTAQMKTVIDRMIPLIDPHIENVGGHNRHVKKMEKIPAIALLSVCGFYELDNFDGLVDHVKRICRNFQAHYLGAVLRPFSYLLNLEELMPEEVKNVRAATVQAGRELVMNRGFSPGTLAAVAHNPIPKDLFNQSANEFWDACIKESRFLHL